MAFRGRGRGRGGYGGGGGGFGYAKQEPFELFPVSINFLSFFFFGLKFLIFLVIWNFKFFYGAKKMV